MRAHPAGGVAEDASARAMTADLAFPIVYPLLAVLQACMDINDVTSHIGSTKQSNTNDNGIS